MSPKSKQTIALILIAFFAFYYANICSFYHSHIINGVTIVHSHLHNKAHTQTGTHDDSELTLISALSVFHSLQVALSVAGMEIFLSLQIFIQPFFEEKITSNPVACISLRGPPL
ncbi:MAG: hypothetical protein LBS25_10060 [Candidatus Symbiothrix sp.]|jgi:hypothetical protein|nr:hypothetical protein [Candidatus Symbiothrix sp.]